MPSRRWGQLRSMSRGIRQAYAALSSQSACASPATFPHSNCEGNVTEQLLGYACRENSGK
jgi:hypothetical protein